MPAPIHITARLGEPLRRSVGRHRLQITLAAPAAVADLLARLAADYPDFAAAYAGAGLGHERPYRLFVNHKQADETQPLHDGDLVHIVVPALGGRK